MILKSNSVFQIRFSRAYEMLAVQCASFSPVSFVSCALTACAKNVECLLGWEVCCPAPLVNAWQKHPCSRSSTTPPSPFGKFKFDGGCGFRTCLCTTLSNTFHLFQFRMWGNSSGACLCRPLCLPANAPPPRLPGAILIPTQPESLSELNYLLFRFQYFRSWDFSQYPWRDEPRKCWPMEVERGRWRDWYKLGFYDVSVIIKCFGASTKHLLNVHWNPLWEAFMPGNISRDMERATI